MNYLYDTDFLYNLFVPEQTNHIVAKTIFESLGKHRICILKIVKFELATVISHKENQSLAKDIILALEESEADIIDLDQNTEKMGWELFLGSPKNKTSFVDCANLAFAKQNQYKILSFDSFYPNHLLVKSKE